MKIGVVGASGYAGGELLRLLSAHPNFKTVFIAAHSNAGESIISLHPHLTQFEGQSFLTNHDLIAKSRQVSNPGCYATAIALSIAPALNLIESEDIVVVAASGTTGAGRTAKVNLIGSEVMNNLTSYKFGGVHQHTPEIEQVLNSISGKSVKISFTPMLAPMPRGILATVTGKLKDSTTPAKMREVYKDFYSQSKFVKLSPEGQMPMTNSVLGTNNVSMQIALDSHVNRLVISTAIDNLGKGAAGQAIQNANLMFNLAEDAGLQLTGVR